MVNNGHGYASGNFGGIECPVDAGGVPVISRINKAFAVLASRREYIRAQLDICVAERQKSRLGAEDFALTCALIALKYHQAELDGDNVIDALSQLLDALETSEHDARTAAAMLHASEVLGRIC